MRALVCSTGHAPAGGCHCLARCLPAHQQSAALIRGRLNCLIRGRPVHSARYAPRSGAFQIARGVEQHRSRLSSRQQRDRALSSPWRVAHKLGYISYILMYGDAGWVSDCLRIRAGLIYFAAQQCSAGVVHSRAWSTSDISRRGGNHRSEVGDEIVADDTGSPPPPSPSQRSRPSRCVCTARRGHRGRGMRPAQRCGCA
jgi:hypothetical protein